MIETIQVTCPAQAIYVSKNVVDEVMSYFRRQVLYAANEIPADSRRMTDLLMLLKSEQRDLDCEWEGMVEASILGRGESRQVNWTCPNCGTYNELHLATED